MSTSINAPPSEAEADSFEERDRRYQAALAAVEARTPTACPLCHSADIVPYSFEVGDRRWECLDRDCLAVFDAPEVGP